MFLPKMEHARRATYAQPRCTEAEAESIPL